MQARRNVLDLRLRERLGMEADARVTVDLNVDEVHTSLAHRSWLPAIIPGIEKKRRPGRAVTVRERSGMSDNCGHPAPSRSRLVRRGRLPVCRRLLLVPLGKLVLTVCRRQCRGAFGGGDGLIGPTGGVKGGREVRLDNVVLPAG